MLFSYFLWAQDVVGGNLDPYSRNRMTKFSFSTEAEKDSLHHWNYSLKNNFQFNQLYVDNWVAGGANSYSGNIRVNVETYYKKNKHRWSNILYLSYGLRNQEDQNQSSRKTDDDIDFTSFYRYNLKKNWFLGASYNLKTQFSKGYSYTTDTKTKLSNFMSPGYITIGLGMDYVLKDKFEISVHPISSRTIFVFDEDLREKFGLKKDQVKKITIGLYTGVKSKFKIVENVSITNDLGIYSEYNNNPLNLDIAYRLLAEMRINNFMTTNFSFETLYDEDQIAKLQIKQNLGVGLVFKLDNFVKKPEAIKKPKKNNHPEKKS